MRVDTLDDEVQKFRKRDQPEQGAERPEALAAPAPPPYTEAVEPCALLDGLVDFIRRFVILDKHSLIAVALWVAFAYCFEIAETSPRLRIKSPDKRCGKSRLLEALALLIPRSIAASNMSPSAIFRTIDAEHCCLLIDEADTFARDSEELRGLINSGHTRVSAYVIRSVPMSDKKWAPQRFSTWCPMAIAGIGNLPDTVEDRSVTILMKRKLRTEKVERLTRRNKSARADAGLIASKLTRFAADNIECLQNAEPAIPDALNDRAADNWEHLLAIADLGGNNWAALARAAAVELSGDHRENADSDSLRIRLLADIHDILEEVVDEEISSTDLCKARECRDGPMVGSRPR